MANILLSGGPSGANWLPLIVPLVAIVLVIYAADHIGAFFRQKKLRRHQLHDDHQPNL